MFNKKNNLGICILLIGCAVVGGAFFFGCNSLAGNRSEKQAEIAKKVAETPVQEKAVDNKSTEDILGPAVTVKPNLGKGDSGVKDTEVPKEQLAVQPGETYSIIIDKSDFTLQLLADGKVLHTFPIATGKNTGDKQKVGDMRTPDGSFYVEDICEASTWTHDFDDGKGVIEHAYGPWFLSLETPGWTGIGIHGTHDPSSIGTRASEGCIRMYNEDLVILKKFVKLGTKVKIQE